MNLNKFTLAFVALLLLCAGLQSSGQQQQKSQSKVDACHEAIQAAVAKKHKINPSSHHYTNDIMQLQPLRHEVEDTCALFEYVATEDRHDLISFMSVAQSRDPRPSTPRCPAGYSCVPLKNVHEYEGGKDGKPHPKATQ